MVDLALPLLSTTSVLQKWQQHNGRMAQTYNTLCPSVRSFARFVLVLLGFSEIRGLSYFAGLCNRQSQGELRGNRSKGWRTPVARFQRKLLTVSVPGPLPPYHNNQSNKMGKNTNNVGDSHKQHKRNNIQILTRRHGF